MKLHRLLTLIACAATLSCAPEFPCDPGQRYLHRVCVDGVDLAGGGGGDASAPGDGGAAGDGGACADPFAGFGQHCTSVADCPCGLDFCLNYGNYNFCTRTGCLGNESICPGGWFCIDTALYQPGGPAICFQR